LTVGHPKHSEGRIDLALSKQGSGHGEKVQPDEEGRRAVTYYRVVEQAGRRATWLALMPITGRTHQLRAHCVAMGTPILGDGKYGGARPISPASTCPRQLHLHARSIRLPRPGGGTIQARPAAGTYGGHLALLRLDTDPAEEPLADAEP